MQHGLDGQEVGEVIAEDELGGPFLDVDNIDVVGEHAELGTLEGIFSAQAVEIVTQVAAAESMTIDGIGVSEVQVYNALGQLVKTVRDANEISVADLAEGVYLLRILDVDGIVYTNKITIR